MLVIATDPMDDNVSGVPSDTRNDLLVSGFRSTGSLLPNFFFFGNFLKDQSRNVIAIKTDD